MSSACSDDLRFLHGLRVQGHAGTAQLADRLGIPTETAAAGLRDRASCGWVVLTSFAGDESWSLTEAGRCHGETLLAAELDEAGARAIVSEVYEEFLPLNGEVVRACGEYQLTVLGLGETSAASALGRLGNPAHRVVELEDRLVAHLPRFHGYAARFSAALARAETEPEWITAMDRDSCHRTWFELHEDLIATLGLQRT